MRYTKYFTVCIRRLWEEQLNLMFLFSFHMFGMCVFSKFKQLKENLCKFKIAFPDSLLFVMLKWIGPHQCYCSQCNLMFIPAKVLNVINLSTFVHSNRLKKKKTTSTAVLRQCTLHIHVYLRFYRVLFAHDKYRIFFCIF